MALSSYAATMNGILSIFDHENSETVSCVSKRHNYDHYMELTLLSEALHLTEEVTNFSWRFVGAFSLYFSRATRRVPTVFEYTSRKAANQSYPVCSSSFVLLIFFLLILLIFFL